VLRHLNGKLFPIGWAKALWYQRKINLARVVTLGVLDKYRRSGIAEVMYLYYIKAAAARGYRGGEMSWILEDNPAMRAAAEKMGGYRYRTYRMYDKPLDG
jgi:hypothetical protein